MTPMKDARLNEDGLVLENGYAETMQELVIPCLQEHRTDQKVPGFGGKPLAVSRFDAENPRGTVVIVHGFTSCVDKDDEIIFSLLQNGWSELAYDQRFAIDVEDASIHHVVLIAKHSQVGYLLDKPIDVLHRVLVADAQQNQITLLNAAFHCSFYGDAGMTDTLNHCSHVCKVTKYFSYFQIFLILLNTRRKTCFLPTKNYFPAQRKIIFSLKRKKALLKDENNRKLFSLLLSLWLLSTIR